MSALVLALGMAIAGLSRPAPGPATLEPPPIRIDLQTPLAATVPHAAGRSRLSFAEEDSRRGDLVGAVAGAVVLGAAVQWFGCGISDTDCRFYPEAVLPAAAIGAIIGAGIGSAY